MKIKEKLCEMDYGDDVLTLDKAIEICRRMEMIKTHLMCMLFKQGIQVEAEIGREDPEVMGGQHTLQQEDFYVVELARQQTVHSRNL